MFPSLPQLELSGNGRNSFSPIIFSCVASRKVTPHAPATAIFADEFVSGRTYENWRPEGSGDWLLIYTVAGSGLIGLPQGAYQTRPGDLLVYEQDAMQDYRTAPEAGKWRLRWAHFRPRPPWHEWMLWREIGPRTRLVHLRGPVAPVMSRCAWPDDPRIAAPRPDRGGAGSLRAGRSRAVRPRPHRPNRKIPAVIPGSNAPRPSSSTASSVPFIFPRSPANAASRSRASPFFFAARRAGHPDSLSSSNASPTPRTSSAVPPWPSERSPPSAVLPIPFTSPTAFAGARA